jgi:hypothetical protein
VKRPALRRPAAPRFDDEAAELVLEALEGDVSLSEARLAGAELAGATGLDRLRPAAMTWADIVGNAGAFAAALGIRLLGEDER